MGPWTFGKAVHNMRNSLYIRVHHIEVRLYLEEVKLGACQGERKGELH